LGKFSVDSLIKEYVPYFRATTAEQLYQQFLKIPPVDTDFLTFLQQHKNNDTLFYLVSDLYPEL
jgi:hypothetical protein